MAPHVCLTLRLTTWDPHVSLVKEKKRKRKGFKGSWAQRRGPRPTQLFYSLFLTGRARGAVSFTPSLTSGIHLSVGGWIWCGRPDLVWIMRCVRACVPSGGCVRPMPPRCSKYGRRGPGRTKRDVAAANVVTTRRQGRADAVAWPCVRGRTKR